MKAKAVAMLSTTHFKKYKILDNSLTHAGVDDPLEVHGHGAAAHVGVLLTVVDEHTQLLGPDLVGTVTKHKQHGVNHVGLAAAVGADDGREVLKETTSDD